MDNRLVLVVLFVTLSWISVGINAQTTNMTTAGALNTTMATNMTAVAANNGTTINSTMAASTTTAPTLITNTTVEALQVGLNRTQCGTQQLCVAEPSGCDPSSGSCFFLAAEQRSDQIFEFGLAGESEGYIAATLSNDATLGGNDPTYVCANDNGTVKFFSTLFNDGELSIANLSVNSVKGKVNVRNIECTFVAIVPSPTTRTSTRTIGISTGSFNNNILGTPVIQFRSAPVDLTAPNSSVPNLNSQTTTTSPTTITTTTSHAITLRQSLTHALLITAGVLGLAML